MATEAEERAQRLYVERAVQALADAGAAVKTAEAEARHAREDLERCQTAATKRSGTARRREGAWAEGRRAPPREHRPGR